MLHALWEPCPLKVGQHRLMGAGRGWGARRAQSSPPILARRELRLQQRPGGTPAPGSGPGTRPPQQVPPMPGPGQQVHGGGPARLHGRPQHQATSCSPAALNPAEPYITCASGHGHGVPLSSSAPHIVLCWVWPAPRASVQAQGARDRPVPGKEGAQGARDRPDPARRGTPAAGSKFPHKRAGPPALLGLSPEVVLQAARWPPGGSRGAGAAQLQDPGAAPGATPSQPGDPLLGIQEKENLKRQLKRNVKHERTRTQERGPHHPCLLSLTRRSPDCQRRRPLVLRRRIQEVGVCPDPHRLQDASTHLKTGSALRGTAPSMCPHWTHWWTQREAAFCRRVPPDQGVSGRASAGRGSGQGTAGMKGRPVYSGARNCGASAKRPAAGRQSGGQCPGRARGTQGHAEH